MVRHAAAHGCTPRLACLAGASADQAAGRSALVAGGPATVSRQRLPTGTAPGARIPTSAPRTPLPRRQRTTYVFRGASRCLRPSLAAFGNAGRSRSFGGKRLHRVQRETHHARRPKLIDAHCCGIWRSVLAEPPPGGGQAFVAAAPVDIRVTAPAEDARVAATSTGGQRRRASCVEAVEIIRLARSDEDRYLSRRCTGNISSLSASMLPRGNCAPPGVTEPFARPSKRFTCALESCSGALRCPASSGGRTTPCFSSRLPTASALVSP
jgi:hypothetical protein